MAEIKLSGHPGIIRTFDVVEDNAGFFGLGVKLCIDVEGKRVGEEIVYGDTLHAVRLHVDAQVSGDPDEIDRTNRRLPKRLQYPVVAKTK